jgi:hypothetical protein
MRAEVLGQKAFEVSEGGQENYSNYKKEKK